MIKLSNAFMAETLYIAKWMSNPDRALQAMRRMMRQTTKLLRAEYVVDLFENLCKQNTPLRSVKLQSEKMCTKLPKKHKNEIANKVMKWRWKD